MTTTTPQPTIVPTLIQHRSSANNTIAQGGVIDNNGKTINNPPPSSKWTFSSSDNIILQQPYANQLIHSGVTIDGTAKVDIIDFILIDNNVGQIASGSLSVVNGHFSGTINFVSHAQNGVLQVYYPNPINGAEEDSININVNF